MKPDPLDDLLRDYAHQSLPPAPTEITGAIRGEIDRRRSRSFWTRIVPLLDWRELFGEPRLAVAALVCAVAIGVLPAMMSAKARTEQRLARQSIHFDVFSARATTQLATLVSTRDLPSHSAKP